MKDGFTTEHPIVIEFYDVWRSVRNPDEYIPHDGSWTDRQRMKALLDGKANVAQVIHEWFDSLSEENQMAIVHASTYDPILHRNTFMYFNDNHKLYRKLLS